MVSPGIRQQTRVKESRLVAMTTRNNTHLATEDTTRMPDTHCPATTPRTSAPPDTNAVTVPTGRQAPGLHAAVRAGVATAQSESASTAFVLLRHSTTRDWVTRRLFVHTGKAVRSRSAPSRHRWLGG